jgi:hypothetical protein
MDMEFFENLGDYVYGYECTDETDEEWFGRIVYYGKGVGKRGKNHIKQKGYNIEDLRIIAKNMERFGKDGAFLLESYLIEKWKPRDNKIKGKYNDCFTEVGSITELYEEELENRRDMYEEAYEVRGKLVKKYGRKCIGFSQIRDSSFHMETKGTNAEYLGFKYYLKGDDLFHMYIKTKKDEAFPDLVTKINKKFSATYKLDSQTLKNSIGWEVDSIEEAIKLWGGFV